MEVDSCDTPPAAVEEEEGDWAMWAWKGNSRWAFYPMHVQPIIEAAYRSDSNGTTTVTVGPNSFELNFSRMTQHSPSFGRARSIRREAGLPRVCWYWQGLPNAWLRYGCEPELQLEAAHQRLGDGDSSRSSVVRSTCYAIDVENMTQENTYTGRVRPITRVDLSAVFTASPSAVGSSSPKISDEQVHRAAASLSHEIYSGDVTCKGHLDGSFDPSTLDVTSCIEPLVPSDLPSSPTEQLPSPPQQLPSPPQQPPSPPEQLPSPPEQPPSPPTRRPAVGGSNEGGGDFAFSEPRRKARKMQRIGENDDADDYEDNEDNDNDQDMGTSLRSTLSHSAEATDNEDCVPPVRSLGAGVCPICLGETCLQVGNVSKVQSCGHHYHTECIQQFINFTVTHSSHGGLRCPVCRASMVRGSGPCPPGMMKWSAFSPGTHKIPGYEHCGTIVIEYHIMSGFQTEVHPNPGWYFKGTSRVAFLPHNREGREVLELLKKAFQKGLTFRVGDSLTTGCQNVVTWNDISHKTRRDGGRALYGYPDDRYLETVRDQLNALGIEATPESDIITDSSDSD